MDKTVWSGSYKNTFKSVLVGSTVLGHLSSQETLRTQALSISKGIPTNEMEKREQQNELDMHDLLKDKDLPNVAIGRKLTTQDGRSALISQCANRGDLNKFLSSKEFKSEHRDSILLQMTEALEQLHHSQVVHRDIKFDNFVVNINEKEEIEVKIIDLGKASVTAGNDKAKTFETKVLFRPFQAPELFEKNKEADCFFDPAIDIYSLGMMFYLLLTEKTQEDIPVIMPKSNSKEDFKEKLGVYLEQREGVDQWPDFAKIPSKFKNLIKEMLSKNPPRPSAKEIVKTISELVGKTRSTQTESTSVEPVETSSDE